MSKIKWIGFLLPLFFVCFKSGLFAQSNTTSNKDSTLILLGDKYVAKVNTVELSPDSNIYYLEQALVYYKQVNSWEKIVNAYNNLAAFHYYNSSFDAAEANARIAKEIGQKNLGKESKFYADALFNLTAFLAVRGFHEEAIKQYQELIIADKLIGTPQSDIAVSYQNMGHAYREIGAYEEAIQAFSNAIRIRLEISNEEGVDVSFNQANIGGAYSEIGDCYSREKSNLKAKELFRQSLNSLKSFDKSNQYVNQIRYNCFYKLADLYLLENQRDSAYYFANEAVKIKNKNSVFDDCFSYLILAKLHLADKEKDIAFSYFNKAIQAAKDESDGKAHSPQIATTFKEKGNAHLSYSEFSKAQAAFQEGLKVSSVDFTASSLYENPALNQIIQKHGALDLIAGKGKSFLIEYKNDPTQTNKIELAYDNFILSTQLIQAIRKDYNTKESKHILAEKANLIYEEAIETCILFFEKTNEVKYIDQAFIFAESNKAITLQESIHEEMALNLSGLPDSLIDLEKSLSIKLNFEEKRLAEAKNKQNEKEIQDIEAKRFNLKEQYDNLVKRFEKEYPQYYQLKYADALYSMHQIQNSMLDRETALLEYFVGEQYIFTFLISKDAYSVKKLIKTPEFERQIITLKQIIGSPPQSENFVSEFQDFTSNSYKLYQFLFQKQLDNLSDEITNLVIVPDDILGSIPHEILLSDSPTTQEVDYHPSNLPYLMTRYFISYSYSSAMLFEGYSRKKIDRGNQFIAFAPSFNSGIDIANRTCTDDELYSLKCAPEEVKQANQYMNGSVIEGGAASKAAFLDQATQSNVIHLATHACVNETEPNLNRIHFSDDYITMFDLFNLKFNADLVVLSACNTGTGKMVKGEGVISLSRGFIQSGVASTLMSLWAVDDCATADVMTNFYKYLGGGDSKNIALQKSKLDYLDLASDKAKSHPYYWAGFLQFGNTNSISISNKNHLYVIFGILILIILGYFLFKRRV